MVGPVFPDGPPPSEKGMRIAAYAHTAGFSGNDLVIAVAVAKAESGWDYSAKGGPNSNGSYDWGLFQINDVHKPSAEVKTSPLANARAAFGIYSRAGKTFKPWAAYNNGSYKKYLAEANAAVQGLKKKGPAWERATIKSEPLYDSPSIDTKPVEAVTNGWESATNAISAQLGKIAGNAITVFIAVALLVLGVVLLSRGAIVGGATGVIRKAIK